MNVYIDGGHNERKDGNNCPCTKADGNAGIMKCLRAFLHAANFAEGQTKAKHEYYATDKEHDHEKSAQKRYCLKFTIFVTTHKVEDEKWYNLGNESV